MPAKFLHLVETRFSVRAGSEPAALSRSWLWERLDLLRRFCMPSVAAQTAEGFLWTVFCDESTDPDVMAELRADERNLPAMRVVTTAPERPPSVAVRAAVEPDVDVLVTTRLDSDDAIADEYVDAIQQYVPSFHRGSHADLLVNFPRGYRLDAVGGTWFDSYMATSSFHSLFERPQSRQALTVLHPVRDDDYSRLHGNHVLLHTRHVTHQDDSLRAWLIVVHGGNVSNQVRRVDTLASFPGRHAPGFTLEG